MNAKQNERPGPILLALAAIVLASASQRDAGLSLKSFAVEEVPLEGERPDEATLVLPVSISIDAENVYVVDAQDCAIKVFSKYGRFIRTIGRQGKNPGEFSFPSGVTSLDGRLYIADKLNYRIQVLRLNGEYIGGFGLTFAPDKVFALGADEILVTHNPMGWLEAEQMLHAFSRSGVLLWQALPAERSGDRVFDAFRNSILVSPGTRGDFYVIHRCEERSVLHYGGDGKLLDRIPADERYGFKTMAFPSTGPRKILKGFCWASDFRQDTFFLLAPDLTGREDLGPGRTISVFDVTGRLEGRIRLPVRAAKMAVDNDRVYVVDDEASLRIFRIVR